MEDPASVVSTASAEVASVAADRLFLRFAQLGSQVSGPLEKAKEDGWEVEGAVEDKDELDDEEEVAEILPGPVVASSSPRSIFSRSLRFRRMLASSQSWSPVAAAVAAGSTAGGSNRGFLRDGAAASEEEAEADDDDEEEEGEEEEAVSWASSSSSELEP